MSLNLRAYPNMPAGHVEGLVDLIREEQPDVLLVQECRRRWTSVIATSLAMDAAHSHTVEPVQPFSDFPPDGCAVFAKPELGLRNAQRLPSSSFKPEAVGAVIRDDVPDLMPAVTDRLRDRYAARTMLAEIDVNGRQVTIGSWLFGYERGVGVVSVAG